jgi:CrcB protein
MVASIVGISVGAALGALLRWVLSVALNALWPTIPLGTLAANLIGGLLIGVAAEFFASHTGLPLVWRLFVITGFMGGLTTFSTFSLEAVSLLQQRAFGYAALHIGLHVGGSLLLTIAGIALVHYLVRG